MTEFNYKDFKNWWENYQANKHILDKKIEDCLVLCRTTYHRNKAMIEDWKEANKDD